MKITTALLADAAQLAEGKLYIHGAGWDRVNAVTTPWLLKMALVLVFQVEYSESNMDLDYTVELLTEDHQVVGGGTGTLRSGVAPDAEPGDPIVTPLVLPFSVSLETPGLYTFRVSVSGEGGQSVEVPFRFRLVD